MSDLVSLARDDAGEAQVVIVAEHSPFLGRYVYEAKVLHADMLWTGCMHGHKTTRVANGCARMMARAWSNGREATEIVEVAPGVIEWQWITGRSPGGAPLGEMRRCKPEPVEDAVTEPVGAVAALAA